MAIDFPTSKYTVADGVSQNSWPGSPSSGDTATANSYTYTYNGTLWVMNNGSTKSFTGGATYTWDGEKWDASNIPDNSNVVQAASSGWADGELLQYNSGSWDSVDLIIDEDNMSSDSDTKIPTQQSVKSYVDNQVAGLIDSAPGALDTLNELAAAIGDDANFATTVTNNIATKLSLAGGTMTGNIVMSGTETVDGRDLSVDGAKLDLIEAGATGDQTAAEIKSAYESNSDTNAYTDAEKTKLSGIETGATADQTNAEIKTAYELNANTNAFTDAEKTKLTGVEAGATADQTDTEIKTAYESNADTNAFTDAEKTKLTGIEAGATADQTAAEIRTLVESANDSNVFTDADHTKLNGIEANATADQTAAEIRTLVESATDSNVFTDAEKTKLTGIEAGATADQTAAEIRTLVESATDSNVFTDADHTKLNGIAAGAEVNVATNLGQTTGTNSLTITSSTGSNITVAEASGSIAGLMSTTHHNKLDGIESGATADQTAAEIKSLYESNSNTNEFSDAEQTKLAGIETGADVTDATNVNAAGAVMNSDTSTASMSFVVDEDNMSSNSPSKVPTQQSVKSYVDNQVASVVDSAPAALDTLNELAAALGDDANFSTTIATSIGEKLPLAGGTMTGAIAMSSNKITGLGTPTASTDASTKGYVDTQISASGSGTVTSVSGISPISVTNGTSTPAISISAATTSAAGTMSSSDKSKLNGIEAGATADQTAAEIKTAYESNANTNEFSDAEQTKLAGIAAGAEVNVQSDWNASSGDAAILNKPTIPTNNNQLTNGAGYITSADGGNAATLDGIDSASFLRSDTNDTFTGQLTISGNLLLSDQVRIGDDAWIEDYNAANAIRIKGAQQSNQGYIAFGDRTEKLGCNNSGTLQYNGSTVWHAGNDGTGSGLDADTVDGIQASSFLRSDASDVFTSTTLSINAASSSNYFEIRNGSDTDNYMRMYCESGTAQIGDTFSGNTDKRYIHFSGPNGSNDPGFIMHETRADDAGVEINEGIIHLAPSDDNANGDYVSIHGTNTADCLKLHTDGTIETAANYTLKLNSGSGAVQISGNTAWHAGNDGAGSGLDADKLDGQHGSYYSNYNNLSNKPTIPAAYTNSSVDSHLNTSSASSGDSLTWNGSDYAWSAASGGGSADVQEFTSSGTWTKPSGCTIVEVYVFGAGGGGGGGGTSGGAITGGFAGPTFIRSGGGGGGSFVKYRFEASDLGSTVSVTIGAGGSGGNGTSSTTTYNHGTAGGDSSFGTLVAKGGMGGPAAALIPNSYIIESSSIVTAYNYLGAISGTDRIPHQSFANWLQYAYPITSVSGNTTAQADLPTAGGCGGGLVDYTNGTSTSAGLGAQGMFAEFHTTGMNSVTAYQGVNAGAVNGNAGSTATNRFQSGNGGEGRSAVVAAVLNGGNGGIAAGGGGGGSSINISMTGGDGGSGGNGYCIVYSW